MFQVGGITTVEDRVTGGEVTDAEVEDTKVVFETGGITTVEDRVTGEVTDTEVEETVVEDTKVVVFETGGMTTVDDRVTGGDVIDTEVDDTEVMLEAGGTTMVEDRVTEGVEVTCVSVSVTGQIVVEMASVMVVVVTWPAGQLGTSGAHEVMVTS